MKISQAFSPFLFAFLLLLNLSLSLSLEVTTPEPLKLIKMSGNTPFGHIGWPIKSAGDINKDGYADIIIGSNGFGVAYIIYGGPTTSLSNIDLSNLSPLTGFKITGEASGDNFGASVSGAGDINKDGYDDIIIGAGYGSLYQGIAYIIYGGPKSSLGDIDLSVTTLDPLTTGFSITGNAVNDYFGIAVGGAGDINKDGYADIIVGARGKNSAQGAAYVIYGREKSSMLNIDLASQTLDPLTTGFVITGNAPSDFFGASVNCAGDINQDGYDDVIIGAYGMGNSGAAYVIYGGEKSSRLDIVLAGTTLNPLTTGFMIKGNVGNDYFGFALSSAGDINKDGYADIIVGAMMANGGKGSAYIIYGGISMSNIDLGSQGLDPLTTGFMITGSLVGDYVGTSVGSAGDINQDGFDDIVIGALAANGGKGGVYVIYGGERSSLPSIDLSSGSLNRGFSISGSNAGDQTGISVDSADINNDGGSDIIIGNGGENSYAGAAYVLMYHFCPANCRACKTPKTCQVCLISYFLYAGQCLATCPIQTFAENGACLNCPAECSKCTDPSTCQGCIDGYTLTESQCVKDSAGEKAAAGAFEGVSIVGASLGSGISLPLNFGLVAKILRNIKYMKLPVSSELYVTFVSWKVGTGFMSAPGSWSDKYSSKELPNVFSRYELQAAFLINFCKPLMMALIGVAIFGAFKGIEVSMKSKKSRVSTISNQINIAASNFALTQFYSNLDDVLFYFILEMRSTKFETGFRICSSLLAIVLLLVGGLFLVLHSKILGKYQNVKKANSAPQLEDFVSRFANINLIFKDFKDTNSLIQSFLMINVGRSVLSSLIIATLFEYAMIQISLLIVLNLLMLVYLWNLKSFQEFTNTCGQIFCEIILFIANICVFLLALFDHADAHPTNSIERLSKCIIVLNFILLFGCIILLLVSLGKMLYQVYKGKKKTKQGPPKKIDQIFNAAKFNRPSPDLAQSEQILATNTDLISASQNNLQPDTYQDTLKIPAGNSANMERNSNQMHQEKIVYNYSIKSPTQNNNSPSLYPQINSFDISNSNIILQSYQPQDLADPSRRPSRPRIRRDRAGTKTKVVQISRMEDNNSSHGSPEIKIEGPSRIVLNQEYSMDQDVSLMKFDLGADSAGFDDSNDFITMNK